MYHLKPIYIDSILATGDKPIDLILPLHSYKIYIIHIKYFADLLTSFFAKNTKSIRLGKLLFNTHDTLPEHRLSDLVEVNRLLKVTDICIERGLRRYDGPG